MTRYGKILEKRKREAVLLKGFPCAWGQCSFCDYISDNSEKESEMLSINSRALAQVTGEFGSLEVINSGSVFELPAQTLEDIRILVSQKNIGELSFEASYGYRHRLDEIRARFNSKIIFKCGVETFDDAFRNTVLNKGAVFTGPEEVARYFDSVCLLVGVTGQHKDMIARDIDILLKYFDYGCVNLYENNTTEIKADEELKEWFIKTYGRLDGYNNVDVLYTNTDFGVGVLSRDKHAATDV